ncbi:fusidic acid esterase [Streptomyces davaonensis JCM 4913]|uniref:Fusidic acid esterase n=1 Tax=Streptomyces davaonensis (strain DSM 101723 / JCM 4913 / KCC S-0913 / 768) TaxID=1214101 RepID=K4RA69_STRDJ|nr:VCBS repeat-containing protein [Streptomyces davaonensis]CCK30077.1 fusidic acid esterase [Streptomyces davaonensis JCM 4913]
MSVRRSLVVALALLGATVGATPLAHAQSQPLRQDFNGDGYEDQVTGVPAGQVAGKKRAGYVAVVYGSAVGPGTKKVYTQASPGVPGSVESHDMFGAHLAVGDLDGDGYADLLVETDNEQWTHEGIARDGNRIVLWGGPSGLSSGSVLPVLTTGLAQGGTSVTGDFDGDGHLDLAKKGEVRFGPFGRDGAAASVRQGAEFTTHHQTTDLAAGDTDGDGITDVVALARDYDRGEDNQYAYSVTVARGSHDGLLPPTVVTSFRTAEPWQESLAVGDVDGDGPAEIVTGAGNDIRVLDGGTERIITQNTPGVPGAQEKGDTFGAVVSVGDVDGDGYGDIVAGNPTEDFAGRTDAGIFAVVPGGPDGPTGAGTRAFSQSSPGVPGSAEAGDRFGGRTDVVDSDGDGRAEPVVSAIAENDWAGAVWLFGPKGTVSVGSGSFGMTAADARFGDRFPE